MTAKTMRVNKSGCLAMEVHPALLAAAGQFSSAGGSESIVWVDRFVITQLFITTLMRGSMWNAEDVI